MTEEASGTFEITLKHRVSFRFDGEVPILNLLVTSPDVKDEHGAKTPFEFELPIPLSLSREDATLHAAKLFTFCKGTTPTVLALLSGSVARFLSNAHFINGKLLPGTFATAVKAFQQDVAADVRGMVRLPPRGNFSKWRKAELLSKVQSMVRRKYAISWNEINEELKKTDPERAPKNGRALQELARTMKISLRDVRAQESKRRVNAR